MPKKRNWIHIHPRAPKRVIDSLLPKGISLFLDLSPDWASDQNISRKISKSLPAVCERFDVTALLARDSFQLFGDHDSKINDILRKADEFEMLIQAAVPEGMPLKLAPVKQVIDYPEKADPISLVDWRVGRNLPVLVESIEQRTDLLKSDRTYWMLGLAGDLGQSLVDWMISHGARYIVISSRNPKVPSEWFERCQQKGATVECIPCDATSLDSLKAAHDQITSKYPPIAGVTNGALVLRDKTFATMDVEDFKAVLKPKVNGTIHLDQLFDDSTLDFFIPFSSVVATMGNLGQSAYSAANNYMKAIVTRRRKRNQAGSTIDIARVFGVGYVEREIKAAGVLTSKMKERIMNVTMPISESDLHQLFAEAILAGRPGSTSKPDIVTGIRTLTSDSTSNVFWAANIKFSHFIRDRGDTSAIPSSDDDNGATRIPIKTQIACATSLDEIFAIFKDSLAQKLKTSLQLARDEEIRESVPIIDLGVDSLVAVEIRTWFLAETGGIDLPVLMILGGASVVDLADDAMEKLPGSVVGRFEEVKEETVEGVEGVEGAEGAEGGEGKDGEVEKGTSSEDEGVTSSSEKGDSASAGSQTDPEDIAVEVEKKE